MINKFKYGQTWKIWPSLLSLSLYSIFKNKAPAESEIMVQVWKSLSDCRETFCMLKGIIIKFGVTEIVPNEWNIGRMIVLSEKGDLLLPKNYWGIVLLKIAYKIIAIILHARLLRIEGSLDHESQSNFRPRKECMNTILWSK